MQRGLVVNYRSLTVEDETDSCPKTSITNYQSTMHNIPEERRPQLTLIHSVTALCDQPSAGSELSPST